MNDRMVSVIIIAEKREKSERMGKEREIVTNRDPIGSRLTIAKSDRMDEERGRYDEGEGKEAPICGRR
ncbi:MAG: hypothetical protein ACI4U2_05800 [Christensenellaceae bacterium]